MGYSKFAERVDAWIEGNCEAVLEDDRLLIVEGDVRRAAKALKKPVEDIEAALAETGFYEVESEATRAERVRARDAKQSKEVGCILKIVMLGLGSLVLLVVGWLVFAAMGAGTEPQTPGEKACSDLGGRTSFDGERCVL